MGYTWNMEPSRSVAQSEDDRIGTKMEAKVTSPTMTVVYRNTPSIPCNSRNLPAMIGDTAPKIADPVNISAVTDASVPLGTASMAAASITGLTE